MSEQLIQLSRDLADFREEVVERLTRVETKVESITETQSVHRAGIDRLHGDVHEMAAADRVARAAGKAAGVRWGAMAGGIVMGAAAAAKAVFF